MKDFQLFARSMGISSARIDQISSYVNRVPVVSAQNIKNEYISPTIIEERTLNVATMDVFSRLMMDRIIFLGCPINDDVANIIQAQLLFLESQDPSRDVTIYINSPGGSVSAGLGIYDTMQLVEQDVATVCTGMAASMGAVLLASGSAGKRSALAHSRIMIHQPLGAAEGQASDIEITAKQIKQAKDELYAILSLHTQKSIKQIEKDADRDFWMRSQQAVEYGIIDTIMTKRERRVDEQR